MDKNLPKVFAVPIEKKIENNKNIFISTENSTNPTEIIHPSEINKIFHSKTHVYKTKLIINTKNETKEIEAIGLKDNKLLALDGTVIPLDEIIEIKKV